MAKPEKRWQLLLVADDGRIIPFRRIRGVAVTLVALLVVLGLVCAGLGWQLAAEKIRHRKALDQFAEARRQAGHYKSEHELIAAELVLAEARMEKAGLPVPRRPELVPRQPPVKTVDAEPAGDRKADDGKREPDPAVTATAEKAAVHKSSGKPSPPPAADPAPQAVPEAAPVPAPAKKAALAKKAGPGVALGDLTVKHDAKRGIFTARFRVKNTGPRSSPVAGRCVVVLKSNGKASAKWLSMPEGTLVNGQPDGKGGQAFRISRYRDMNIRVGGQKDPSPFTTATVYVFDTSGAGILEKEFPIDLPAPEPVSTPAPRAVGDPAATDAPAGPVQSTTAHTTMNRQAPVDDSGPGPGNLPTDSDPDAGAGTAPEPVPDLAPADDPSLTDNVEPVKKEDARARF